MTSQDTALTIAIDALRGLPLLVRVSRMKNIISMLTYALLLGVGVFFVTKGAYFIGGVLLGMYASGMYGRSNHAYTK